MKNLASL